MRLFLVVALLTASVKLFAQSAAPVPPPAAPAWAEITLAPGATYIIAREDAPPGDQIIVRTFYWQDVQGLSKPILRSVIDVIALVKNVPIAAAGAPDPAKVETVHIDIVRNLTRLEWKPQQTPVPPAIPTPQ